MRPGRTPAAAPVIRKRQQLLCALCTRCASWTHTCCCPPQYIARVRQASAPGVRPGRTVFLFSCFCSSPNQQHFYLAFRRRCLHPDLHTGRETTLAFNTLGDWEANPSTKLAALVRVLTYHLKSDARSPMTTVDGELVDGPDEPLTTEDNLPCDKIVVYSAFVINTRYIKQVSAASYSHRSIEQSSSRCRS